jgi:AbrB family looped-hinge helix DNA binding protein
MRTTIDKAERVVIPLALRKRIGLAAGGEVEIEIDGAAIRIEPVVRGELRDDGGLLLIPATGVSIDDTVVHELMDVYRPGR